MKMRRQTNNNKEKVGKLNYKGLILFDLSVLNPK